MIGSFNRVLVVLNTFENIESIIEKALKIISVQDSILEILYVHETALFDIPDFFSLKESSIDKDKIKKKIKSLVPYECAVFVYVDDTVDRVLELTKDQEDLLIVVDYHESITKKMVNEILRSFFVFKKERLSFKNIIIPIDLNTKTLSCINFSKKIFTNSDIKLLHDYSRVISKELKEQEHIRYEALKKDVSLEGYSISEYFKNEIEFVEEIYSIKKHIAEFINGKNFDLGIFCSNNIKLIPLDLVKIDILILNE